MSGRHGWYRTVSGALFHGPIPPGATEVDAGDGAPVELTGEETKAELVAVAEQLGVSTSGTKAELFARIRAALVEQSVDAGDSAGDVAAGAFVDEGTADAGEFVDGDAAGGSVDEDPDAFGHEG